MAEAQRFQRRTVLVKPQLQFKQIGLVFASVLCAVLIIGGDIYYYMYRLIVNEAPSLAQAVSSQFTAVIFVKFVLYLGLMLLISVFISHRFAGPIFRFEKSARIVAKGDLSHRVCLRTGDELMELQEEFNAMIAGLQVLVQKDRAAAAALAARLEAAAQASPEVAAVRQDLQRLTQAFKV